MVEKFHEQKFVVDHLTKPFIKDQELNPWEDYIYRLANFPIVWCKISGMVTEADPDKWQQDDFTPYLDVVTEAFGVERLMTGSDWPVGPLAGEYSEVLKIPVEYFHHFDEKDKEKNFHKNCLYFYNIKSLS